MNMESEVLDVSEKSGILTTEFLDAHQLVYLRKPDEDSTRYQVGEKYYTRSDAWLEKKAVECSLGNFKDVLNKKRASRICDLMQAEWNEELNVSITSKLKGKFVQHMGRASNGKIALSPEESIFLLENGCVEILNGEAPISTEEAYKIMLKDNLSLEKYQVYSQLSQLGFIVVPHQTELGITKYEKRLNLDKYQTKKKRKFVSEGSEEPENKRLTFSGAFSNELKLPVDSMNQETPSTLISADSIAEIPATESEITCNLDEPVSLALNKVNSEVKESEASAESVAKNKEAIDSSSDNAAGSAVIVNEIEECKEASSNAANVPVTNHNSNAETTCKTVSIDTLNESNAQISCNKSSENSMGIEVELETVEVVLNEEISVQQENADSQSCVDTNSNPVPADYERGATLSLSQPPIDVMNIDSQNTEISCTSEEPTKDNNISDSNINVTSEDSSCSVMDSVIVPVGDKDSNSDIMSCSSDDDILSVGDPSECNLSENSEEDDEIKLLEVTKKETKPLAVIDLLSDDEREPELSGSDDDIQVVKVCNGALPRHKSNPLDSIFKNSYKCKKEEKSSPNSSVNRSNFLQLSFPNCARKAMVVVTPPPSKYLPSHVCPSKEAYIINFKSQSEPSQPQSRVWNSFKDMQDYQRSRRLNRHGDQSFQSFQNRGLSRRAGGFSFRDTPEMSENNMRNPWAEWANNLSRRDDRHGVNRTRNDPAEINQWQNRPHPRDVKQNLNHRRTNSSQVFPNYQNSDRNSWLDRHSRVPQREEGHHRSSDSAEVFPNLNTLSHSTNPFNSTRNLHQNAFQYPQNAAAAINSVVSVSNQDMNVSMVGNHILQPPLHSSSPHLPSFNANLPNLSAIGPVDIMAEVQRTAYTVATSMLSSMFGQNTNPLGMPQMPPFNANAFQPQAQNGSFLNAPAGFNSFSNVPNFRNEYFPSQNRHAPLLPDPFHRQQQHRKNPFPCQYRNLRNRNSWNEVKEAVGGPELSLDVGSDVEEVPISPTDILWDPKNICPLVKPGTKYHPSEVLKKLQITHMAKLLSNSNRNAVCFSTTCSIAISFDVYLPGTNYKKTCPGIPKHRIIVVRSTDPIPKYSDIAFLQKKWNDGATLQIAVVDNGDISYQSFNSICLPVLIPHEK